MDGQNLKNSILQLAVQGRLVEQNYEEETGHDLYRKILKIRKLPIKNNSESVVSYPFELPESWKWINLGDIVEIKGGKRIPVGNKLQETNNGRPYIRVADMKNGTVKLDDIKYVPLSVYEKIKNYTISTDDLYITVAGTIGAIGFVPKELDSANLTENANKIKLFSDSKDYLFYVLSSPFIQNQIKNCTTKVGQPKLAIKRIKNLVLPLPPLQEQKRIVKKIETIIPNIEKYNMLNEQIENMNNKLPIELKKSILQYTIQGKLVEQDDYEGTGHELFNEIQVQREKLYQKRLISKPRNSNEVEFKDIPFEIPKSWKWTRLGDIIELKSGQDLQANKYNDNKEGVPYITGASNIENSNVIINRWTLEPKAIAVKGDLLLTCKGTIGKTTVLEEEKVHIARQIMGIRPIKTNTKYINIFLQYYTSELKRQAKSMIPGINREMVLNALIPLPPLGEQERIVQAIKKIMINL